MTLHRAQDSHCRLVLIDFDWQDADLLPELLRAPDVSIRLVAGAGPDDPGVRTAALCGLPRTQDLTDLTREIFDVALVGERSARLEPLARLLRVLGTSVQSPQQFVRHSDGIEPSAPSVPSAPPDAPPDAPANRSPAHAGEALRVPRPPPRTLLTPAAFSLRLGVAIDRHLAEGVHIELFRLTFDGSEAALEGLLRALPDALRETDAACCPSPQELLLLCTGAPRAFAQVRQRIAKLWGEGWAVHGSPGVPPPIAEERVELALATPCGDTRP